MSTKTQDNYGFNIEKCFSSSIINVTIYGKKAEELIEGKWFKEELFMKINKDRIAENLENLAQFGKDKTGGWTRFSYTPEYKNAQTFIKELMEDAGMKVKEDAVGNLIGRLEGSDSTAPIIAAGSHIDTVQNGGKFDGNFGVIGAIEVVKTITENNVAHTHPIEVISFIEEEGSRTTAGLFGSRIMAGELNKDFVYKTKTHEGRTIAEIMEEAGYYPKKVEEARVKPQDYRAYFEMHIEQGSVLENEDLTAGIVMGIAAPLWLKVTLYGRSDHAGATPMHMRKDALCAASEIILDAERIANEVAETTVATCGKIDVKPGGVNIVPGEVEFFFDIRDIYEESRGQAAKQIEKSIEKICSKRDIKYKVEQVAKIDPVILPDEMIKILEDAANDAGVSYKQMISGAGHDAQIFAKIVENVGMIFCPSIDGLSHCPEENTDINDLADCTQILLNAMLKMI